MIGFIPYVLAAMILYDFSAHVFSSLIHFGVSKTKHPFGMYKLMDKYGGKNKKKRQAVYDIFWTSYWGIASILIIIYLIFK